MLKLAPWMGSAGEGFSSGPSKRFSRSSRNEVISNLVPVYAAIAAPYPAMLIGC